MNFNFGKMDVLYTTEEGFINYNRSQKLFNKLHGSYETDTSDGSGRVGSKEGEIKKVKGLVTLDVPDDQDWLRNKLGEIDKNTSGRDLDVIMQRRKGGIQGVAGEPSVETKDDVGSARDVDSEQVKENFKIFAVNVDYKYLETVLKQAIADWDLTTLMYDGEYGKIKKETMEFVYEKIKKFAKKRAGENLKASPSEVKYFIIHIIVRDSENQGRALKDSDVRNLFKKYPTQIQRLWNVFKTFMFTVSQLERKIATSRERGASEAERDLRKLKMEMPDI